MSIFRSTAISSQSRKGQPINSSSAASLLGTRHESAFVPSVSTTALW
ncbi:hypothetical protein [Streptomyces sp. NPDC020742]